MEQETKKEKMVLKEEEHKMDIYMSWSVTTTNTF